MKRFLTILALIPGLSWGALTLDQATNGNEFIVTAPTALSHAIGSGSDRILLVGVSEESNATPSAPTYNGTTMTLCTNSYVEEATNSVRWYYLLDASLPSTGTYDVAVTFGSGSGRGGLTAISYEGAEQVAPTCNITGSATSGTTITSASFSSGDVAIAHYNYNVAASSFAPGAGQTEFSDVAATLYTHGASYKTVSGSTTMSATTASNITLGGVISVATISEAAPSQTVTFNQSNYALDDLIEATATGYSGTLSTMTVTGGDTISPEAGASSAAADYTTKALSEYTASGSANNTQWGVSLTGTIAPDNATDTFVIDAPATSVDFFFNAACASASCPTDSLIHATNGVSTTQDVAVNDDVYCRFTSGSGTINASGVPMFSGNAVIECRRFQESTTSWGNAGELTFTAANDDCVGVTRAAYRSALHTLSRVATCGMLY